MDETNRSDRPDYLIDLLSLARQGQNPSAGEGEVCMLCKQGTLEYDGMLNLVCPFCGYRESGAST